jgi:hypothetical protein
MKKLSSIDRYINESLRPGTLNIKNGNGQARIVRTSDGMGFNVDLVYSYSAHSGDLPKNAQADLERVMNEIEEKLAKELPWLQ